MIRLARKVRKGKAKVAKVAKAKVEDPMAKVTMEATVAWLKARSSYCYSVFLNLHIFFDLMR